MTYESVREFSAFWGLVYFAILFAVVLVYALSPRNQRDFDRAARMPLIEDDQDDRQA